MVDQPRFLAAVPALPVSDERRAVEFLTGALGMQELQHEGRGIGFLRRDQVQIQLWVPDGSASGAERYLAGSASCRVEVTGIDELYRHCLAFGVIHPNAPLQDQAWGTREFAILDPDHNLITLYQRPVPA
ncbi:MAG: hypothetical protein QOE53_2476 [Pseudonocardiales bacterium]|jgi:catechol 2,3-dioxygenase-like lactoylglutathione lyase family enzyme|nr:hypothetical protein [Pseudonocardiales bacterium]